MDEYEGERKRSGGSENQARKRANVSERNNEFAMAERTGHDAILWCVVDDGESDKEGETRYRTQAAREQMRRVEKKIA